MPDRNELGMLLQRMRDECGESLTLMAARLGMTRAYLSAIELGKRRPPVGLADKVSSAYELTVRSARSSTGRVRGTTAMTFTGRCSPR